LVSRGNIAGVKVFSLPLPDMLPAVNFLTLSVNRRSYGYGSMEL
jgi:hypothetical protein